jgi:hypothetical protein
MFADIMSGPTAIDVGGVSALGQALVYREDEEARRSDKWGEELAQRLEVDLSISSIACRAVAAGDALRRPANRSRAHIGRGGVAIALLAVVLHLVAVSVLGGTAVPVSARRGCVPE